MQSTMSTIQNNRNYCSTCKKQLSTGSAYSNHIKSKKHSLKLLEFQPFQGTEQRLENSNYINANITNYFYTTNLRCNDGEYDDEKYYNKKVSTQETEDLTNELMKKIGKLAGKKQTV